MVINQDSSILILLFVSKHVYNYVNWVFNVFMLHHTVYIIIYLHLYRVSKTIWNSGSKKIMSWPEEPFFIDLKKKPKKGNVRLKWPISLVYYINRNVLGSPWAFRHSSMSFLKDFYRDETNSMSSFGKFQKRREHDYFTSATFNHFYVTQ